MSKQLNILIEEDDIVCSWSMGEYLFLQKTPAIRGRAKIVYEATEGKVVSMEVDSPTFADLFRTCNILIKRGGDEDVVIEDIEYEEERNVWVVLTGS